MIDHVRIWMRAIAKRVLDLRAGLTRAPKRWRKSRKTRSAKPNVPRASLFGERRLAVTMIWSLVAALAVYAASYELQKISGFSPAADEGGDDLLSLQADQSAYPGTTIPIVAIDFNDEAFAGLGWPPFVPRDQLSRVMKIATNSGARLLVVDVDIGWATQASDVSSVKEALNASDTSGTPTILIRDAFPGGGPLRHVRKADAYDDIVERSHYLRYASFSIVRESDGVARRVLPWDMVCESDKGAHSDKAVRLPGAHMLAAAALTGEKSDHPFRYTDRLFEVNEGDCGSFEDDGSRSADLKLGDARIGIHQFNTDLSSMRLLYRISWSLSRGVVRPTVLGEDGEPRPAFLDIPASAFVSADPTRPISALRGAIVVIGASAAVSGDHHATPLGQMPGMGILINALGGITVDTKKLTPWYMRWALDVSPFWIGLVVTILCTFLTWAAFFYGHKLTRNHTLLEESLRTGIGILWILLTWLLIGQSMIIDIVVPQLVVTSVLLVLAGARKD